MNMTTGWLLLLLMILSHHSVNSQSTIDDERCDGDEMRQLRTDIQTLLNNQLHVMDNLHNVVRRLGEFHKNSPSYGNNFTSDFS